MENPKQPPVTAVILFLPRTPTLDVLQTSRPLRLQPRNVRIKHGYAWVILLRNCKLALAEGISLTQGAAPLYLLFTPAVEEQETKESPQRHEVIPAPAAWKKENKFLYKSPAIEEYLLRLAASPVAATA